MKKISVLSLVLWLIIIFLLSHQPASISTETSTAFTRTIINIVNNITGNNIDEEQIETIVDSTFTLVRKIAHLTEYLILGILMINVVKNYQKNIKKIIIISLLSCILYACTDEIHQLFVPGRSGQLLDVFIDTIGSIIGIFSYKYMYHLLKIKKNVKIS